MAASSINAISGLLDHMYICTGKTVAGSKKDVGVSAINATMPIISKGKIRLKSLQLQALHHVLSVATQSVKSDPISP